MLEVLAEGGKTRQPLKLNGLSANVFLIKIVIQFHGRRGPLRTIVLPKWQAPSLVASLRAKEGREVTWRGMGEGTFPSGVKKAKWEVGGAGKKPSWPLLQWD